MLRIKAKAAVEQFGQQLVGQLIVTQNIGDWEGGNARVLEINPDPEAPEIVMTVRAERVTQFDTRTNIGEVIGVFDYETVSLWGKR